MDTPYWERLQYVGDTRIQALISYTVAGDDRLARQAIQAFNDSRIPDGITQSRYPTSSPQYIPTFSLLWIGIVHDFWLYRGDPGFVRAQLAGTRTVLDWFLQQRGTVRGFTKVIYSGVTTNHLAGELCRLMTNIKMTHVPYKGGGPVSIALLSGEDSIRFA